MHNYIQAFKITEAESNGKLHSENQEWLVIIIKIDVMS